MRRSVWFRMAIQGHGFVATVKFADGRSRIQDCTNRYPSFISMRHGPSMYFEQIKTLMALADGRDPVIGGLAKMMLTMLEALRDAEMRADLSEAQLDAKRDTLAAIRAVLVQAKEDDPTDALRKIVGLLD